MGRIMNNKLLESLDNLDSYILDEDVAVREYDTDTMKARCEAVLEVFQYSSKTIKDFKKALNMISKLEYDNLITKDIYDEYIRKVQDIYVNKDKSLTETVGHAKDETVNAVVNYYISKTHASIKDKKETHDTGGGLSPFEYVQVVFDDGVDFVFTDTMSRIKLEVSKGDDTYSFDVREGDYREQLDKFIDSGSVDGYRYKRRERKEFTRQDAIDKKGNVLFDLEKSGDNKDQMFAYLEDLRSDFPAIFVEGMWNTMNDGKLMTVSEMMDYINKYHISIYGGRDTFTIYENLVYIKIGS